MGYGLHDWIVIIYTLFGATGNYSAIAYLHTSQFIVTHTIVSSVSNTLH
jgi:hypothetical protein